MYHCKVLNVCILLFSLTIAGGYQTRKILYRSMPPEDPIIELWEYKEIKDILGKNPYRARLVDVREKEEVNETGMIPTSINLPMSELESALALSMDEFKQVYNVTKPTFGTHVVFYCQAGVRSFFACKMAIKAGYKKIANYEGGMKDYLNQTWNEQDDRWWENVPDNDLKKSV